MSTFVFDKISVSCGAGLLVFITYIAVALRNRNPCDFMKGAGAFIGAAGIVGTLHMVMTGLAPPTSIRALEDASDLRVQLIIGAIGVGWLSVVAVAGAFRDACATKATISDAAES